MSSFYDGREAWFLTGSQDLHGEGALRQVADQSRAVVDALNASGAMPAPVVWKPVLKDSDSIKRAMLEANSDEAVLGVISWMHTLNPAKKWIRGLEALNKPLLHLATQANAEIPWSTIDMDFTNLNQAAHGDREYAYILTRLGVPRAAAGLAATTRCATRPARRRASAPSSTSAEPKRSPPVSRTSARCANCPVWPSSASPNRAADSAPRATGRPRCSCAPRRSWGRDWTAGPRSWRTTRTT